MAGIVGPWLSIGSGLSSPKASIDVDGSWPARCARYRLVEGLRGALGVGYGARAQVERADRRGRDAGRCVESIA